MSILAWEATLTQAGTVTLNCPYTSSLLFKYLPQQQADTTDWDIMLCYTGPQTPISIILHTVPDPIFVPGIWCPNQGFVWATNLFTSLRRAFSAGSVSNSLCLPCRKSLCDTEGAVPPISIHQWRRDTPGWQMRCSTSLMCWEPTIPYYVGGSLSAGFEATEYERPCASPFKGSLKCSKKQEWTLRWEGKLRTQSLTFQ